MIWEELPAYSMIIFGSLGVAISSFVAQLMLHGRKINRFFSPIFPIALVIAILFSAGTVVALWYVMSHEILFKWISFGCIFMGSVGLVLVLVQILFLSHIVMKEYEYLQ